MFNHFNSESSLANPDVVHLVKEIQLTGKNRPNDQILKHRGSGFDFTNIFTTRRKMGILQRVVNRFHKAYDAL